MKEYLVRAEVEIIVQANEEDEASEMVTNNICLGCGAISCYIKSIDEE